MYEKMHFGIIRFVHETLYGISVNPYDMPGAVGLKTAQRVLEVGCGPGAQASSRSLPRKLSERVGMYAIDVNAVAVEYVERKVRRQGLRNVNVILAGADKTTLPNGTLDTVLLFGVIHALWKEIGTITSEIYRVLKTQGTLSISKSRLPDKKVVEAVTTSGMFRLKKETDRVLNFERLPSKQSGQ
jgi:ubiquinone/menaquinone biosynthesis C-methylase UbiE